MDKKVNQNVKCTVGQCTHHCGAQDYCSLSTVTIGTHEQNPKSTKCTDCQSFVCK